MSANIILTKSIANSVPINFIALEEDFDLGVEAYMTFLLDLSDITIQIVINCFQVQITNTVKYIDYVCYYYCQFVDLVELNLISDNKSILMTVLKTTILHYCNLNICGCSKIFNFCHDYWNQINRDSKSKFGISNKMLQLCY